MNATRTLPALAVLALLAIAPVAHAGSSNNPQATDPNDDVQVNGGVNCGVPVMGCVFGTSNDFTWNNADTHSLWVTDTADAVVVGLEMKAATAFTPGTTAFDMLPPGGEKGTFSYAYTYTLTSGGANYGAVVAMDDQGVITVSGAATTAFVHDGNRLDLTFPKANIGEPGVGDIISGVSITVAGKSSNGGQITLGERIPDANFVADYVLANGTGGMAKTTYYGLTNKTANVAFGTTAGAMVSGVTQYNWTQGPVNGTLSLKAQFGMGTLGVKVLDAAGSTVYNKTLAASSTDGFAFVGAKAGAWRIVLSPMEFMGNLTLAIVPQAPPATTSSSAAQPSTSFTQTVTVTPSAPATKTGTSSAATSSTGKGTPGFAFLAAVAALGAVLVLRRRLD